MVIGGGIAGISAALNLAEQGIEVFLVEKKPMLGGHMAQLDKTFPTLDCSICILAPKMVEAYRHPRINVLAYSEVRSVQENGRGYSVDVLRKPRYVDEEKCTGCGICLETCPVKDIDDEFDEGLGQRRAIYMPFPQAVPRVATIDSSHCLKLTEGKCGVCYKKCPSEAINYKDRPEKVTLDVCSIIVTTGFDLMSEGIPERYALGRAENVITSLQYERMLNASGPTSGQIVRPSDGESPSKIGFVLCAGSRDTNCRDYCSRVCCMYASKDAELTREHLPDSEVFVFHNDLRVVGKGHEEFLNRTSRSPHIKRISEFPGGVEETQTNDLLLRYYNPDTDGIQEGVFDLLVLFTPIVPSEGAQELAEVLGIEVGNEGFVTVDESDHAATTRDGIFVAGCASGPNDISISVAEATAAAASAANRCSTGQIQEEAGDAVEEIVVSSGDPPRIGVYVCSCGVNIGGVVDVDSVVDYVSTLPDVAHVRKCMYACSQDNQNLIQQDILDKDLNRILIGACSPRSHLELFRDTCSEVGLNRNLVEFVSLREMDSWVHQEEPEKATEKAKDIIRMGTASARYSEPRELMEDEVAPAALVIGGGIAGMSAALTISTKGFSVVLVEKASDLGGSARKRALEDLRGVVPQELASKMADEVRSRENIEAMTSTDIIGISGSVGNFTVQFKGREASSETLDRRIEVFGTIVLATGAKDLDTSRYYNYQKSDRIIDQVELERRLAQGLEDPDTVVQILCVGCRNEEREYCSLICCENAVKDMIRLKEASPSTQIYCLYRDMRVSGLQEKHYTRARDLGINFVRYDPDQPPIVDTAGGLEVKVRDIVTYDNLMITPDLVVLSTALVPGDDNHRLSEMLKVPLGENGFFLEAHPKLRPVDFSTDGVYVAGTAHGPKNISESVSQGMAAASRAMIPMIKGSVLQEPTTAFVDSEMCTGCARCVEACPYGAMGMKVSEFKVLAEVNQLQCKGCGKCAVACPSRAISIFNFTNDQIIAQIDEALREMEDREVRGIAFLCNWCAYAGADNAGVSRFQYPPNILPIRVMCSGRVDPFYILYALLEGADGVLIGGCHPGDCHYGSGNDQMKHRTERLRAMVKDHGIDPDRIRIEWISAAEGRRFAEVMKDFVEDLERLGHTDVRRIATERLTEQEAM